jgi:ELWxxDGT repeat protein
VGRQIATNHPVHEFAPLEPRRLLAAVPLGNLALSEGPNYTTGGPTSGVFNGAVYYAVSRSTKFTELWKTDGTPAGTTLIRTFNVFQSTLPNDPPPIANFTACGGSLYFTVGLPNSVSSFQLWRSDGTTSGTTSVTSFNTGILFPYNPSLTAVGNTLFFLAPGASQTVLWQSDGTTSGTKQVYTGSASHLTANGATLYFASDGLYKVTATAAPLKVGAATPSAGRSTVVLDGVLYYVGAQSAQQKLYRYDGTAAPQELAAVNTNGQSPELTAMGTNLYFASLNAGSLELWQSDGTSQGTQLLKDINPTGASSPSGLTAVGNTLYFSASDGTHGAELWKSDGTPDGTALVTDLIPGTTAGLPTALTAVGGSLYFSARTTANGYELWRSDGTISGTLQVADLYRGPGGSRPHELLAFNDRLYFQATDSITGYGLFTTQPDSSTVTLLTDYNTSLMNGTTSSAVTGDGRLLFAAGDGSSTGRELFVTDGGAAGTSLFKDIFPAAWIDSSPSSLTNVNGRIFFSAIGSANQGVELWSTDGTPAGTTIVKDAGTFPGQGASPTSLFAVGSTLYYVADDGEFLGVSALWKSDGTDQGTVMLSNPGNVTLPGPFILKGTTLYFLNGGDQLQSVNQGSSFIGTVKDFSNSGTSSPVSDLALAGTTLYMSANNGGTTGFELWRSDGTQLGTVLVKDINTNTNPLIGSTGSNPSGFTDLNGIVYFKAQDVAGGFELWRTNGTAAGTQLVKDIRAGSTGSSPLRLTKVGSKLLFTADDGVHGRELWQTDGTGGGTVLLADLNAGLAASDPADFTLVGGLLYFTADDGGGRRLWVSDGLPSGTHALTLPGSNPMNLVNVNGILYYTANDGLTGPALYKWDPAVTGPTVSAIQFNPDGPRPTLTFDFSAPVAPTLRAIDIRLRNVTTGQTVDPATLHIDVNAAADRATVAADAALIDGNYQLALPAGTVRDSAGVALSGDVTFNFFSLAGDANRDRAVDFLDLAKLAQNYNTTGGKSYADGNFNGDSNVDFLDLAILAQRYNTSLPLPGSTPSAAPAASFSADWALATASVSVPLTPTSPKLKKPKPKPVFAVAPVVRPVPAKPKAAPRSHARH